LIDRVQITGPFSATGPGDTASRRKILTCHPTAGSDEIVCAKKIIGSLARQAYRRPATDGDIESLLNFYQAGRNKGDFEDGIERALQAILSDPEFVFRGEADPANVKAGEAYRISDLELASRLAFFLWSTSPDDELINLASQGKLKDPKVLEQQVKRMLADDRSEALVKNFAGQWLMLRNLQSVLPDPNEFPNFDDEYHNVFSYSKSKRFDLGRYRKDEKPAVQVFDQPGVVRLRCEIHEHMRGTILVLDTPCFTKTDTNGVYRLENAPAGNFVLKAWVDEKTIYERSVEVKPGETLKVDFPGK